SFFCYAPAGWRFLLLRLWVDYMFYFLSHSSKNRSKILEPLFNRLSFFLLRTRWVALFAPATFNELYVLFSSHSSKNRSKI
ncbi:MAG: hypothetical protein SPJ69_06915, partial [Campylobacter sp.]|uniref:hypothetical protein n=1 Tax=Campylobacter sp. TaxID=205 RepID=UPI00297A7D39